MRQLQHPIEKFLSLEKGIFLWDVAAGASIVGAAGGKVSISNLQPDYRVDAMFSNNQIEEMV